MASTYRVAPIFARVCQTSTIVLDLRNGSTMRISHFPSICHYAFLIQKVWSQKSCLNNINQLLCDCLPYMRKRFRKFRSNRSIDCKHCAALQLLTLYFYNKYTSNFKKKKKRSTCLKIGITGI